MPNSLEASNSPFLEAAAVLVLVVLATFLIVFSAASSPNPVFRSSGCRTPLLSMLYAVGSYKVPSLSGAKGLAEFLLLSMLALMSFAFVRTRSRSDDFAATATTVAEDRAAWIGKSKIMVLVSYENRTCWVL